MFNCSDNHIAIINRYGDPAPSGDTHCFGLRFVCALEAFMGMLYVSFCGAILFAKIVHLNTVANVTFSSALLIQYGPGVRDHSNGDEEKDSSTLFQKQDSGNREIQLEKNISSFFLKRDNGDGDQEIQLEIPSSLEMYDETNFPVMEFRIVNNHANRAGSEIVDASLTCTVGIIHDNIFSDEVIMGTSDPLPFHSNDSIRNRTMKQRLKNLGHQVRQKQKSISQSNRHVAREKIPIFKSFIYNLEVEPRTNPLFSRVWYVRHILDQHSPLLKPDVRNLIMLHHGRWPRELSDPTSIRNSILEFRQVVVTLCGTSMVTLENVFYAKTYIFEVCLGFYNEYYVFSCYLSR